MIMSRRKLSDVGHVRLKSLFTFTALRETIRRCQPIYATVNGVLNNEQWDSTTEAETR